MPNIDNLSIQFSAKGTTAAVKNIKDMGLAIRSLATNINSIDANKLDAVASSMNQLKKSAPTKDQTARVTNFGNALKGISQTFEGVNVAKISEFADSMSAIKKAAPTKSQSERVGGFSNVLGSLSGAINGIDGTKLGTFASGMDVIKKSIPTKNQVERISSFATAVTELSNAIGAANIGEFSKDMSVLGSAVEQFKKSSVNSITNAVAAMQNMKQEAQNTANTISNATPKSKGNPKMGNNADTLKETNEIIASLEKVQLKTVGVARAFEKMGLTAPTKQFKNLEAQAEKVRQKYEEVRAALQKGINTGNITKGDDNYDKKMKELDALRNKYNELILKQRELAQEGGAMRINPTLTKSLEAFKSGFSTVTGVVKNGFVAALRYANKHVSSFGSRLKSVASSLKNTVSSGTNATKMAKKFANELLRVSKMLKLMVTRMALRKVIAEVGNGFKSLAIHSDEFNNSVSSMMNGAKQLGYSFASLVSPLINALAPAIVYVINLLTKLLNAINQVMSALLGFGTWNKAKTFTDSWRDSLEDAGSSAKKTAKELKKTVLGFDELNQLQDNKENQNSGGKNQIADMFETLPIDKKWKDIADWLKQMWKIGDFTELGKKIGEKLRDMLESIPWEQIRKTANKLGKSLATLINGFVEVERLGYDIGYTIAQSVNTVFEFLNGFVHNLHWDSIGKFIAETFNGFFENIDWALIKDTVVTGMAGIAEAIQNFIDTFHWDNISNFIINGVDTVTSGILAFFDGIDWLDLGKKIGEQIRKSIEGIDFYQVGQAIGAVIQAAVDWVSGMLETLPSVETLIQKATDLMHGLFERVDVEQMGANLGKILDSVYKFLVGFWEENGDEIKAKVAEFFKGFWDNIDKEELKKVLSNILWAACIGGIIAVAWTSIKSILAQKISAAIMSKAVTKAITSSVAGLATDASVTAAATGAGEALGGFFAKGLAGTALGIDLYKNIKDMFKLQSLKAAFEEGELSVQSFMDKLKELGGLGKSSGSTYIIDSFLEDSQKLQEEFKNGSISATEYGREMDELNKKYAVQQQELTPLQKETRQIISDYAQGLLTYTEYTQKLQEVENKYKSTATSAKNASKTTSDALNGVTNTIKDTIPQITTYENEWAGASYQINGIQREISQSTTENMGAVKTAVNESMQSIKTDTTDSTTSMSTDWQTAQKTISDVTADISKTTATDMDDVKKTVDDSMKEVNKSFDTVKDGMTESKWTFDGVAEGLTKTFENAKKGIKNVWNSIADTLNGEYEIGEGKFKIKLPKFNSYAMGGIVEDGLFFANHSELVGRFSNGKTAVANNTQIIEGISAGVYNATVRANAQNGGSDRYIANTIVVDGEVIARSVTKAQQKQNMRYSPQTV